VQVARTLYKASREEEMSSWCASREDVVQGKANRKEETELERKSDHQGGRIQSASRAEENQIMMEGCIKSAPEQMVVVNIGGQEWKFTGLAKRLYEAGQEAKISNDNKNDTSGGGSPLECCGSNRGEEPDGYYIQSEESDDECSGEEPDGYYFQSEDSDNACTGSNMSISSGKDDEPEAGRKNRNDNMIAPASTSSMGDDGHDDLSSEDDGIPWMGPKHSDDHEIVAGNDISLRNESTKTDSSTESIGDNECTNESCNSTKQKDSDEDGKSSESSKSSESDNSGDKCRKIE